MPRRSLPASPEPDLFGLTSPPRACTPPVPVALPAPVLAPLSVPAPAARSVTLAEIEALLPGWSEAELTRLRDLAAAELARRIPPAPADDAPRTGPRQRRPELLAARLTPAQVSMVRAAAEAGIGALRIARQFALPLAAVQQVLDPKRRG